MCSVAQSSRWSLQPPGSVFGADLLLEPLPGEVLGVIESIRAEQAAENTAQQHTVSHESDTSEDSETE